MLVYHPVYDVNHCLYRMLLVLEASAHEEFEWDTFQTDEFLFGLSSSFERHQAPSCSSIVVQESHK